MSDADHDRNQNPRTQAEQERLAKLRLLGREVRLLNRFDARYQSLKNESAAREQQYIRELEDATLRQQALTAELADTRRIAADREHKLQLQLENSRLQLQGMVNSRSWKLTKPLRDAGKLLGKGQPVSEAPAEPWQISSSAGTTQSDQTPAIQSSASSTEEPGASALTAQDEDQAAPPASATAALRAPDLSDGNAEKFFTGGRDAWDAAGSGRLEEFLSSNRRLSFRAPAQPTVSIVVVLYNKAHLSFLCLESLMGSAGDDYELVLVDNGSTDGTGKLLERIDGAKIVRNAENTGFGYACGQGAANAAGEYLCFLNNDAMLCPGALTAAVAGFREDASLGAVGGKLLLSDGRLQEAGSMVWRDGTAWGYGRSDDAASPKYAFRRPVDYCSGALLFTPRALFEELGGFDARFLPAYYEDTDYCFKVWDKGRKVIYEPRAAAHHYESASMQNSATATALIADHQQKFVDKWKSRLEQQLPLAGESIPCARIAAQAGGARLLYLCARVPHRDLGPDAAAANAFLTRLAAEGHHVTCVSATEPLDADEYADLPREIEFADAGADAHYVFRDLLTQYDAAWIAGGASMREFLGHMWNISERVPLLIYEMETISGKPGDSAADRTELQLTFCQAADIVLVQADEERQLLPLLESRIEVRSESTTQAILSDILNHSKQRQEGKA